MMKHDMYAQVSMGGVALNSWLVYATVREGSQENENQLNKSSDDCGIA